MDTKDKMTELAYYNILCTEKKNPIMKMFELGKILQIEI